MSKGIFNKLSVFLLPLVAAGILSIPSKAEARVDYQGVLLDTLNNPISSGQMDLSRKNPLQTVTRFTGLNGDLNFNSWLWPDSTVALDTIEVKYQDPNNSVDPITRWIQGTSSPVHLPAIVGDKADNGKEVFAGSVYHVDTTGVLAGRGLNNLNVEYWMNKNPSQKFTTPVVTPGYGLHDVAGNFELMDSTLGQGDSFTFSIDTIIGDTLWYADTTVARDLFFGHAQKVAETWGFPEGFKLTRDVGITEVIDPAEGTVVDSTEQITPQAKAKNFTSTPVGPFDVIMNIGSGYADTATVTYLGPNDSTTVSFRDSQDRERGSLEAKCYTTLGGDINSANDTTSVTVFSRVINAAIQYLAPDSVYMDSTTSSDTTFGARVLNTGNTSQDIPVSFDIGTAYHRDTVLTIPQNNFRSVVYSVVGSDLKRGISTTEYSTDLSGDMDPSDNAQQGVVFNRVKDDRVNRGQPAEVVYLQPGESDYTFTPTAFVRNNGNVDDSVPVSLEYIITNEQGDTIYNNSQVTEDTLPAGQTEEIRFNQTTVSAPATYQMRIRKTNPDDMNPTNDQDNYTLTITNDPSQNGWREMVSIPSGPSGKAVKRGGDLAFHEPSGVLYATKGNKTGDFYNYNPSENNWTILASVPTGPSGKPVDKGGCIEDDEGNNIYATKGRNTPEFWRYSIAGDSWYQMPDVPLGPSNKKVKGGTDLALVDESLYLLKGYKTEFYKYDLEADNWDQLEDAPTGVRGKWDKGSFMVYDPVNNQLLAHKAKYHELWAFDIASQSWETQQRTGMPFIGSSGRRKKSKDGGSGVYDDGKIRALKGGNTPEFWAYDIAGDNWVDEDPMPEEGSTGRRKKVKYGADIQRTSPGVFYALKGNKTLEMWRYVSGNSLENRTEAPIREGVQAEEVQNVQVKEPKAYTVIGGSYLMRPSFANQSYDVIDVSGRVVHSDHADASGGISVDKGLNAGVYRVRSTETGNIFGINVAR
ncbi:MAG: hypothetical protein ABH817_00150 [archaeon]